MFMSWLRGLVRSLGLGRRSLEQDLEEELRFHLEMEAEENQRRGVAEVAARRQAKIDFGGLEAIKEACRDVRSMRMVEDLVRDLKESSRSLLRSPMFTLAALLSLGIGVAATAVIFSLVDAVLLRPFPFEQPERLVRVYDVSPQGERFSNSDPNVLDYQALNQTMAGIAAFDEPPPQLSEETPTGPRLLRGESVSANFFSVLGVDAVFGRTFGPDEAVPGSQPRVVVLGHDAWQARFASDPDVIGRELVLDGEGWCVIGVLPPGFSFLSDPEIYIPYVLDESWERGDHRIAAIGRLADGVTLEQSQADLTTVASTLEREYPSSNSEWGIELVPFREWLIGPSVTRANLVLLGSVSLLLLLGCANVSNLLLARASHRRPEIALRLALGAGRPRVVRQLLTEAGLLGVLGAGVGLLSAFGAVLVLRNLEQVPFPRMEQMTIDLRVLLVTGAIALATSLAFGLAPAFHATARGQAVAGRGGRGATGDRRGASMRAALVIGELALATVLASGAGLLARSFYELSIVHPGFDSQGVLVVDVALPQERYAEQSGSSVAFFRELEERLSALPGVSAVGAGMVNPFRGPRPTNLVAREDEVDKEGFTWVQWRGVTPDYFKALRIPILRGDSFSRAEDPPFEAIVTQDLADRLWPGENPVGKRVRWNRPDGPLPEVVGVVAQVRDLELEAEPPPMIYLPNGVIGWPTMALMVRTDGEPEALATAVRSSIQEIDPLLAPREIATLESNRRAAMADSRLNLYSLLGFAIIAIVLASVGVFGVISYAAALRKRELGVRVALGARPRDLTGMMVRRGALMVSSGVVLGVVGSLTVVRTLSSLLYATSPFDPLVLALVPAILVAIGLLASWAPARRAASLNPVTALRDQD